jgi:hypothetical protein
VTEKFDLTFAVPEQKLNLVPCLMPESPGSTINLIDHDDNQNLTSTANSYFSFSTTSNSRSRAEVKKETKISYDFDYLPAGLFNRAQVRLFQITDNKVIWRYGSLLKKNNHLALVTRSENKIKVEARGIQPENLIFLIHEVIETLIAESFNGVDYDFSFPCPDCYENAMIDTEKSMFSASLVRRATKTRAVFLQCRNQFHAVPIVDLHSRMPPDSTDNYDLQLNHSIRDLKYLKQKLSYDIVVIYCVKDGENEKYIK